MQNPGNTEPATHFSDEDYSNANSDVDDGHNESEPSDDSLTAQLEEQISVEDADVIPSPEELLNQGNYLLDCPSWLSFIGEESRSKYSVHFVSRNDKIWELLATEHRYLSLLVMVRDVYMKEFPSPPIDLSSTKAVSKDTLFPYIDDLIEGHTRLLYYMLKYHQEHEDRVVDNLGECFMKVLKPEMVKRFVQSYGQLMCIQSTLSERLANLKCQPSKAALLLKCEQDPRAKRRTVSDCYMIIVQRWIKIETLITSIITDTIATEGTDELDNLELALTEVQTLLLEAQQRMADLVHADKLLYFADHLKEDFLDMKAGSERTLKEWMTAPDAKIINYDKVTVQSKKESGKIVPVELWAIALEDCFFLLQEIPENKEYAIYTKMQMPTILIWKKHFGYFRDDAKSTTTFYIIMEGKEPSLEGFNCATHDEVIRWQKVFSNGFNKFGKEIFQGEAEDREKRIEENLAFIRHLDAEILSTWRRRNDKFSEILKEVRQQQQLLSEDGTSSSGVSNSGALRPGSSINKGDSGSNTETPQNDEAMTDWYGKFIDNLLHLGTSILSLDPTSLSRSNSDVSDRRTSTISENPKKLRRSSIGLVLRGTEGRTIRKSQRKSTTVANFLRQGKSKLESSRRSEISPATTCSSPVSSITEVFDPSPPPPPPPSSQSMYTNVAMRNSNSELSSVNSESSLSIISSSTLNLIDEINKAAVELFNKWCAQRTQLLYLETKSASKQERESLRLQQKKLEEERKEWNTKKQKEDARRERENQKLITWANELKEQQRKCDEEKKTRQMQDDMRAMANPIDHQRSTLASNETHFSGTVEPIIDRRRTTGMDSGSMATALQGGHGSNDNLNGRQLKSTLSQDSAGASTRHPNMTSRFMSTREVSGSGSSSTTNSSQLPPSPNLGGLSGRLASKTKVKSGSIKKLHILGGNH